MGIWPFGGRNAEDSGACSRFERQGESPESEASWPANHCRAATGIQLTGFRRICYGEIQSKVPGPQGPGENGNTDGPVGPKPWLPPQL